uniref:FTH domain-containing protein n=1 Tax=Caenorhabditis tropicalis TaxID=1561998 RepID=A0A1I7UDZ2_9PELO
MNLEEQTTLQDNRSSEVFTNPLLMDRILVEIECQCLRKVSRGIRLCVDSLKPDPQIAKYKIKLIDNFPGTVEIYITTKLSEDSKYVKYRSREFLLNDDDQYENDFVYCDGPLIERVVNDFRIIFQHQVSMMSKFNLKVNGEILKSIGNVLKSRDTPLNVEMLKMKVANEKDIMSILPYLDSVESIEIGSYSEGDLSLSDVSRLDQWRNACELKVEDLTIMNSIQELNLHNFQEIDIKVNNISTNDFIYLKEIAEQSKKFIYFKIDFEHSLIDDSFYTSLPPYMRNPNAKKTWYFPLSSPQKFLQLDYDERINTIYVYRVDRDRVPEDFLIDLNDE